MKISTGKGTISLPVLLAIWSVSAVTSLPGLAVSPILGDLNTIFPSASDLEIQMLTSLPSLLIIPFVLLSGKLSVGRDKLRILVVGLVIFLLSGIACLFIRNITALILVSCILGIGAGMVIPLSTGLVVAYFTGEYRVRQLGYSSSINNLTLVLATALSGSRRSCIGSVRRPNRPPATRCATKRSIARSSSDSWRSTFSSPTPH